jgi:hypothetical protein
LEKLSLFWVKNKMRKIIVITDLYLIVIKRNDRIKFNDSVNFILNNYLTNIIALSLAAKKNINN